MDISLEEYKKRVAAITRDKKFLEKLAEAARLYGWNGDYTEVEDFVIYYFNLAGMKTPNLTVVYTEDKSLDNG